MWTTFAQVLEIKTTMHATILRIVISRQLLLSTILSPLSLGVNPLSRPGFEAEAAYTRRLGWAG